MKAKILLIAIMFFNVLIVFSQDTITNNRKQNKAGPPYVQDPGLMPSPTINNPDLSLPRPNGQALKGYESQDEMGQRYIRESAAANKGVFQANPNMLSDISKDLTGKYKTITPGNNNEEAYASQSFGRKLFADPLILIGILWLTLCVILLIYLIKRESRTNIVNLQNEKEIHKKVNSSRENSMSKVLNELQELGSLRESGIITEDEFNNLKKEILGKPK